MLGFRKSQTSTSSLLICRAHTSIAERIAGDTYFCMK